MSQPSLRIGGVGLWLPGVPHRDAWLSGARGVAPGEPFEPPAGASIDRRSRRRASPLCRALGDSYADAAKQAGIDPSQATSVFGSALGEVSVMLGLLAEMWKGEEMSPMAFATSVHGSASGVVSISSKNRGFTTAIAADVNTPGAALLEARGLAMTMDTPVIVVCGDESSPRAFLDGDQAFDMLAVAIALLPPSSDAPGLAVMQGPFIDQDAELRPRDAISPLIARNPQSGLLDLAAAVLDQSWGKVRLDHGRDGNGDGWVVDVVAPG